MTKEKIIKIFDLISKEEELEAKHHNLSSIEKELFTKQEKRKKLHEEKEEVNKKIQEKNNLENEIQKSNIMLANKKETIENNKRTVEYLIINL